MWYLSRNIGKSPLYTFSGGVFNYYSFFKFLFHPLCYYEMWYIKYFKIRRFVKSFHPLISDFRLRILRQIFLRRIYIFIWFIEGTRKIWLNIVRRSFHSKNPPGWLTLEKETLMRRNEARSAESRCGCKLALLHRPKRRGISIPRVSFVPRLSWRRNRERMPSAKE